MACSGNHGESDQQRNSEQHVGRTVHIWSPKLAERNSLSGSSSDTTFICYQKVGLQQILTVGPSLASSRRNYIALE